VLIIEINISVLFS